MCSATALLSVDIETTSGMTQETVPKIAVKLERCDRKYLIWHRDGFETKSHFSQYLLVLLVS